jgi:hypothetical protein
MIMQRQALLLAAATETEGEPRLALHQPAGRTGAGGSTFAVCLMLNVRLRGPWSAPPLPRVLNACRSCSGAWSIARSGDSLWRNQPLSTDLLRQLQLMQGRKGVFRHGFRMTQFLLLKNFL